MAVPTSFAFAPTVAPSSGANQNVSISWNQPNWDPFGNGGLNAAGPAGLPIWIWLAGAAAFYWFVVKK